MATRRMLLAVLLSLCSLTACGTGREAPAIRGVVANAGGVDAVPGVVQSGAPVARVEFEIESSPADIQPHLDAYAQAGVAVLLLAGFHGRMPDEQAAQRLGVWAAAFGPASKREFPIVGIEFGNETSFTSQYGDAPGDSSYSQRARRYAELAVVAADAVSFGDPAVPFVAQGDDGNTGRSDWLDEMLSAAPELATSVDGWTLHPYGPTFAERVARTRAQLDAHDVDGRLWITEWGVASDAGRCLDPSYAFDLCMDADIAADEFERAIAAMPTEGIEAFFVYQAHDQRPHDVSTNPEHYYGVLTGDGAAKGAYTDTVRRFWERG